MQRTQWMTGVALAGLTVLACGDEISQNDPAPADAAPETTVDGAPQPDAAVDPPMGEAVDTIQAATVEGFNGYEGQGIHGRALLVRLPDGSTQVQLAVTGLEASTAYPAHVHNLPCEFDNGGGHYLLDPDMADDENNGIWLPFTTDDAGTGFATAIVDHTARGDALSVVVHDPNNGGTKMACGDIFASEAGDVVANGTFSSFAAAETIDEDIDGTATMVRSGGSTTASVSLTGLDAAEIYTAHVHAMPCDVQLAGGHYKRDPTLGAELQINEIWFTIAQTDGAAEDTVTIDTHRARADAQSVTLHRGGAKVACADLTRVSYPPLWTSGTAQLLDAAFTSDHQALSATAEMTRTLGGFTQVELSAFGLAAGETYPVHVHDRPCSVDDGGGHYKIDAEEAETIEENEVWLPVTADDEGAGTSSVEVAHTARPEAQSLVVHHFDGGDRLACIDLD